MLGKPVCAVIVFFAGVSYGAMAPVSKSAFASGFSWQQTVAGQMTFGLVLFAAAFLVQLMRGVPWQRLSLRTTIQLLMTGMATCATAVLYSISLTHLPVAVSLTLLFQFTWIGVVMQAIVTRRLPNRFEAIAAVIVVAGTVFASGMYPPKMAMSYSPLGLACACGSSVTCALFMFLSSRVATDLPPMQRGTFVCLGAVILAYLVYPGYLFDGTLAREAGFGFMQGLTALFLPVLLFGIGGPGLPTGVVSILASSELPASIFLSMLFLGEVVSGSQMLGIAVILFGVVVSQTNLLLKGEGG